MNLYCYCGTPCKWFELAYAKRLSVSISVGLFDAIASSLCVRYMNDHVWTNTNSSACCDDKKSPLAHCCACDTACELSVAVQEYCVASWTPYTKQKIYKIKTVKTVAAFLFFQLFNLMWLHLFFVKKNNRTLIKFIMITFSFANAK